MTPFEYLLPLISVIVGLAVADLAVSLHRMLRARHRVQWDWLPLVTALLALLTMLEVWWILFGTQEDPFYTTVAGFLPLAGQLILLFLLNAAALPDAIPEEGLDLKVFYNENAPYFWSLYSGYIIFIIIQKLLGFAFTDVPEGISAWDVGKSLIPNFVILISFIIMARSRSRRLHVVLCLVWLVLLLVEWWNLELVAG